MGMSQQDFAYDIEMDRTYFGGIERGERNVALVNIEKIIKGLDMQPSEFFKALDTSPDEAC